jgi:hypothetical protein
MTTRRPLGTGPAPRTEDEPETPATPRLLPVERITADHDPAAPLPEMAGALATGRRKLGSRGRQ